MRNIFSWSTVRMFPSFAACVWEFLVFITVWTAYARSISPLGSCTFENSLFCIHCFKNVIPWRFLYISTRHRSKKAFIRVDLLSHVYSSLWTFLAPNKDTANTFPFTNVREIMWCQCKSFSQYSKAVIMARITWSTDSIAIYLYWNGATPWSRGRIELQRPHKRHYT